jgi:murein tripeptide amidase MpaA
MISVTSNFDGGNIEIVSAAEAGNVQLKIRNDTKAEFFQWFYFRISGVKSKLLSMNILNAGEASYPEGWEGYQARASYDKQTWFLVPSRFDGKVLSIEHQPEQDSVFYAFFAPYSYEQHLDFVSKIQKMPFCELQSLGKTIENRDIDFLKIGDEKPGKKKIWVLGRQHPGESMASFFMEGFISRLLSREDPVSRVLLEKAVFYMVPFINPDGAIAGNLRANAAGINLNREWANPDPAKAPEVFHILNKMKVTGVDLNLDIHGDECLSYNFISSIEGIPSFDVRLKFLLDTFKKQWLSVSPDYQVDEGYPINEPGTANLNICSKAIGERFRCLSMTIEMPFKDNANLPDPVFGWSPGRSEKFGASLLDVMLRIVDDLR